MPVPVALVPDPSDEGVTKVVELDVADLLLVASLDASKGLGEAPGKRTWALPTPSLSCCNFKIPHQSQKRRSSNAATTRSLSVG